MILFGNVPYVIISSMYNIKEYHLFLVDHEFKDILIHCACNSCCMFDYSNSIRIDVHCHQRNRNRI